MASLELRTIYLKNTSASTITFDAAGGHPFSITSGSDGYIWQPGNIQSFYNFEEVLEDQGIFSRYVGQGDLVMYVDGVAQTPSEAFTEYHIIKTQFGNFDGYEQVLDQIDVLSGIPLSMTTIKVDSVDINFKSKLNLISGDNITLTKSSNATTGDVSVRIDGYSSGGGVSDGKIKVQSGDISDYIINKIVPGDGISIDENSYIYNPGCVAEYLFNEAASGTPTGNLLDYSGNNYDLNFYGDVSYVTGSSGRGVDFKTNSGTDVWCNVSDVFKLRSALSSTAFTIEYVIDPTFISSSGIFLNFIEDGNAATDPSLDGSILTYSNNTIKFTFKYVSNLYVQAPLTTGYHVIHIVVDTSNSVATDRLRMYIDGSLASNLSCPLDAKASNDVGSYYGLCHGGEICYYMSFYSKAFSSSYVATRYNQLLSNNDTSIATIVANDTPYKSLVLNSSSGGQVKLFKEDTSDYIQNKLTAGTNITIETKALNTGLVAEYLFNEKTSGVSTGPLLDSSGNNYNSSAAASDGYYFQLANGTGYHFQNSSFVINSISGALAAALTSTTFTFEFAFSINDTGWDEVVYLGSNTTFYITGSSTMHFVSAGNSEIVATVPSGYHVYHLVYDSTISLIKIYIDGFFVNSTQCTQNSVLSGMNSITIGRVPCEFYYASFYNKALTSTQIYTRYSELELNSDLSALEQPGQKKIIISSTGGSGGSTNTYGTFTDGTNATSPSSSTDTFRFRTANNILSTTIGSDDATYGDNLLLTVNQVNIDHGTISGLTDDDHSQYVHNTVARTITAQHSFSPGSATAPFTLGANAQGQLVTGLNADQLDGQTGTYYQNASNLNSGTIPTARFDDTSHGTRSGGSLHADVTTTTDGFMVSADKIKLDLLINNSKKITVSNTEPTSPSTGDIWIVIG